MLKNPPSTTLLESSEAAGQWIETASDWLGVEAQSATVFYAEVDALLAVALEAAGVDAQVVVRPVQQLGYLFGDVVAGDGKPVLGGNAAAMELHRRRRRERAAELPEVSVRLEAERTS